MNDLCIEKYRLPQENDEHWAVRKDFIQTYKDDFPEYRLLCLSQIYADTEVHESSHPSPLVRNVHMLPKNSDGEQTADDHKEGAAYPLVKVHQRESTNPGSSLGATPRKRSSCEAVDVNSQEISAKKSKTSGSVVPSDSSVSTSTSVRSEKSIGFSASKGFMSLRNSYQENTDGDEGRKNSLAILQKLEMTSLENSCGQEVLKFYSVPKNLEDEKGLTSTQTIMQKSDEVGLKNLCDSKMFQSDALPKKKNDTKQNFSEAALQKSNTVSFGNSANQKMLQFHMLPKSLKDKTRQNSLKTIIQKSDNLSLESSSVPNVLQVGVLPVSIKDETPENFLQSTSQKSGTMYAENTGDQKLFQFDSVSKRSEAGTQHNSSQTAIQKTVTISVKDSSHQKLVYPDTFPQSSHDVSRNSQQIIMCKSDAISVENSCNSKGFQFSTLPNSLKDNFVAIFQHIQKSIAKEITALEILHSMSTKFNLILKYHPNVVPSKNNSHECSFEIDGVLISKGEGSTKKRARSHAGRLAIGRLMWLSAEVENISSSYFDKSCAPSHSEILTKKKLIPGVLQKSSTMCAENTCDQKLFQFDAISKSLEVGTQVNSSQTTIQKPVAIPEVLQKSGTMCAENTGDQKLHHFDTISKSVEAGTQINTSQTPIQKAVAIPVKNSSHQKVVYFDTFPQSSDGVGQNSSQTIMYKSDSVSVENSSSSEVQFDTLPDSVKDNFVAIFHLVQNSVTKRRNAVDILNNMSTKFNLFLEYRLKVVPPKNRYECSFEIDGVLISKGEGLAKKHARRAAGRLAIKRLMGLSTEVGNISSSYFGKSCTPGHNEVLTIEKLIPEVDDPCSVDFYGSGNNRSGNGCNAASDDDKNIRLSLNPDNHTPILRENFCQQEVDDGDKSRQNSSVSTAQKLEFVNIKSFSKLDSLSEENLKSKFMHISEYLKRSNPKIINPVIILNDVSQKFNMKVKFNLRPILSGQTSCLIHECSLQMGTVLVSKAQRVTEIKACKNAVKLAIKKLMKLSERVGNLNSHRYGNVCCLEDAFKFDETNQNSSERTAQKLQLENFCSMDSLPENLKSKFIEVSEFIMKALEKRVYPVAVLNSVSQKFKIKVKFNVEIVISVRKFFLACECSIQIDNMLICKAEGNTKKKACFKAAKVAIHKLMEFSRRIGILNSHHSNEQGKSSKRKKPKRKFGNSSGSENPKVFATSVLDGDTSLVCPSYNPVMHESSTGS